ncbi:MAG: DUF615 domain-containing protein [Woeseia sp.]|nr:DUF615 domain-containing protein [Woeseia sp.]
MNSKPSKSAKKREAQAIDSLANRLLALTDEQLASIPVRDELRDVIMATRKMTSRSALRRQRLYLAKQLRNTDCTEIRDACDKMDRSKRGEQRLFHQAEKWRDRFLNERSAALTAFSNVTGRDCERLQQLVDDLGRNMPESRERQLGREIFREIHTELSAVVQDNAPNL